jgi:acyl carrier protein
MPKQSETDRVAGSLVAFINDNIMAHGHPISPDDDLERAGVDSMAFLKILLFVEREFGFWMPDEDLLRANIASARALASYICRRGKPA